MPARPVFFIILDLWVSVSIAAQYDRGELMVPSGDAGTGRIAFEEVIHFHQRQEQLEMLCRAGYAVRGCTDFPEERLNCSCVEVADGWKIVASAQIRAEIHVLNPRTVLHERQHLADLKQRLHDHLARVLAPSIPNGSSCRMKAKVMSTPQYLRDVMNRLRTESNAKYQCS